MEWELDWCWNGSWIGVGMGVGLVVVGKHGWVGVWMGWGWMEQCVGWNGGGELVMVG